MADRPSDDQSLHDQVVSDYAGELDQNGWSVFADNVPGYGDPSEKNGHIPDISASKSGTDLIVEVETDKNDDRSQRRAFKSWARGGYSREYRGVVANSDGSWTQFESE